MSTMHIILTDSMKRQFMQFHSLSFPLQSVMQSKSISALVASGWLKLRPVGASSSSLLCSALADICKRSRSSTMGKLWRHCEFTTTLSVRAGFIAKSANVEVFERKDGRYIQIYATAEWLCRAVSAVPRGCSPLRDITFLANLKSAVSRPEFQ